MPAVSYGARKSFGCVTEFGLLDFDQLVKEVPGFLQVLDAVLFTITHHVLNDLGLEVIPIKVSSEVPMLLSWI